MFELLDNKRIILANILCDKAIKSNNIKKEVKDLKDFDEFVYRFFGLKFCNIESKYCQED